MGEKEPMGGVGGLGARQRKGGWYGWYRQWGNFISLSLASFPLLDPSKFFVCCFGCARSLLLSAGFLQLQQAEATRPRNAQASHCGVSSCYRAHRLQELWLAGLAALQHVGS